MNENSLPLARNLFSSRTSVRTLTLCDSYFARIRLVDIYLSCNNKRHKQQRYPSLPVDNSIYIAVHQGLKGIALLL